MAGHNSLLKQFIFFLFKSQRQEMLGTRKLIEQHVFITLSRLLFFLNISALNLIWDHVRECDAQLVDNL